MKKLVIIVFLIILAFSVSSQISAQDSIVTLPDSVKPANTKIWVNLGLGDVEGWGNNAINLGLPLAGSINLSLQYKYHLFSIKYYGGEESSFSDSKTDKLSGFNLTYGFIYKKPRWYCSISSGINFSTLSAWTFKSPSMGGSQQKTLNTYKMTGIPLDAQIFVTQKWIGIGLNYFLVFNKEINLYGGLVCLQLGKLR